MYRLLGSELQIITLVLSLDFNTLELGNRIVSSAICVDNSDVSMASMASGCLSVSRHCWNTHPHILVTSIRNSFPASLARGFLAQPLHMFGFQFSRA